MHRDNVELVVQVQLDKVLDGLDSAQIEKALDTAQQDGFLRHWLKGGLLERSTSRMEKVYELTEIDQRDEFIHCWMENAELKSIAEEVLKGIDMEYLHAAASISQRDDFVKHWIEGATLHEVANCVNKHLDADDLSDILEEDEELFTNILDSLGTNKLADILKDDMELLTNLLDSLGIDVVNTWMATKQLKLDSNVKVLADNLKRPANSHVAKVLLDDMLNHEPLIAGLSSEQRLKLISKLTLKCEES